MSVSLTESYPTDFSILLHNRPVLPFHEVNYRLDSNHQPHVIQRYGVPCPQNNQYRRHDEAVYSMWMHFVTFCSMESTPSSNRLETDAEIAAFAHPAYSYPLKSAVSSILASSERGHSNNFDNGQCRQGCIFLEETLAVNPFINVSRLDVFRTLSSGEGLQSSCTTKESSRCSSAMSSTYASMRTTRASSPVQVLFNGHSQHQPPSQFLRTRNTAPSPRSARSCSSSDFHTQLDMQDCHGRDRSHIQLPGRSIYAEECKRKIQRSNSISAASHPYYNQKTAPVSAFGLRSEATLSNRKVFSTEDRVTSLPAAVTSPFISQCLERRNKAILEGQTEKMMTLKVDNEASIYEENKLSGYEDESKRSLCNLDFLSDAQEHSARPFSTSFFANISATLTKPGLEAPTLPDGCHLPIGDHTPQSTSPFDFGMASPTTISDIGSFSPPPMSEIPKSSFEKIQSMEFESLYRRGDATHGCHLPQSNHDVVLPDNVWRDLGLKPLSISPVNDTYPLFSLH